MSDPQQPHGLQPPRLLRPWDFPGILEWGAIAFSAECAYIHINMYMYVCACVRKISKGLCIASIIDLFQTWRRKWQTTHSILA